VITLELRIPDAGRLVVRSTTKVAAKKPKGAKRAPKAKTITYAASVATARSAAALVTIKVKPGKAAAEALALHGKLRVTIAETFTPKGGASHTQTVATTATSR
jgi:hypothetical protein